MAEITASGFSSFSEQSAVALLIDGDLERVSRFNTSFEALDGTAVPILPIWQNPAFQERPYHPITPSWRRPRTVVTNT